MTSAIAKTTSKEDEMMVLGCALNNAHIATLACDSLEVDCFEFQDHKILFSAMKSLWKESKPIDTHLVCQKLKEKQSLGKAGGVKYIVSLAQYAGTSAYAEEYIDNLIDASSLRQLQETINNHNGPIETLQSTIIRQVESTSSRKISVKSRFQYILEPCSENQIIEDVKEISEDIPTGMKIGNLDLELPGGAITIVAAPTSHGKTTMQVNLALGVLKNNPEKSVYFFSYEESRAAIMTQFVNSYVAEELSQNNRKSIESFWRTGGCKYLHENKKNLFLTKKQDFFETLVDTGRLNIFYSELHAEQLVQAIRFIKDNRDDVAAIFIDYMQLLNPLNGGSLSRQEQLKKICLMLKNCSVETGLPIVIGAQFNRQVTCEADLSPICISEAGDIERIASLILGFWNRQFLGFSKEGNKTKRGDIAKQESKIYIEVLKGRKIGSGHNGLLGFRGNIGKIDNSIVDSTSDALSHRFVTM